MASNSDLDSNENRRARRRRALHEHIYKTASAMFLELGFEATTVEMIADKADVAQATFFNHFPTKTHVLHEMAEGVFLRFHSLIDEQRRRPVSTGQRLLGFADRAALAVERAPELTRRVLLEVLDTVEQGESERRLVLIQNELRELLLDGQRSGDLAESEDADLLAEITLSVIVGTMAKWIHDPGYPLRKRMHDSAAFLGRALTTTAEAEARSRKGTGSAKNTKNTKNTKSTKSTKKKSP